MTGCNHLFGLSGGFRKKTSVCWFLRVVFWVSQISSLFLVFIFLFFGLVFFGLADFGGVYSGFVCILAVHGAKSLRAGWKTLVIAADKQIVVLLPQWLNFNFFGWFSH